MDNTSTEMNKVENKFTSVANKLLGQTLTLEHLIFLCGAFAGIVLSLIGVIGNLAMELHLIAIIIPLINLIIDISCVVYSIKTKRWKGAAILVYFFASFVLFPFLWFTSGGTMSSNLPLVIGLGVVLAIVFNGKVRIFFFFATLLLFSTLIMVELYFPNNFIPYPSREAQYTDILIGFVLSYLASGGLAFFTLLRYNAEKKNAEDLVSQLEVTSITDPLTNVYNRRYLMIQIDEEMRSAYDSGKPLSLCILDIDHFKLVNDTYGHLCGDEVLVLLAKTISSNLDKSAMVGRYGGEEFIIIFPNRNIQETIDELNKLYEILKNTEWPNAQQITVSCGVSEYTKGISYSKFLEESDQNLYKAKNNGRNRIEY